MTLLNKLFHFVLLTTKQYNIDESHGVSHSMNVLRNAKEIFDSEIEKHPIIKDHENIIYVSAVLHDMCDKKYMDQSEGIKEIEEFLSGKLTPIETNIIKLIISTMSYSKVKINGFPNLGPYKRAYHIVREADLLSAYDFDRCIIYNMYKKNGNLEDAYEEAIKVFEDRIFKHNEDSLFITDFSRKKSLVLESESIKQINTWKKILKRPNIHI